MGIVNQLLPLTTHKSTQVRREIAWSFSNLLASSSRMTALCLQQKNVMPQLINMILTEEYPDVAKEAAWALANALQTADLPTALAVVQTPSFIQAFVYCLLHNDQSLVSETYFTIKRVLEASTIIGGNCGEENWFVEYLRIHCFSDVSLRFSQGGNTADEVEPLYKLFLNPASMFYFS